MTEWVTIKIPEAIREQAKADDRTYGEIMEAGLDTGPEPEPSGESGPFITPEAISKALEDYEGNGPVTLEATEYKEIADEVEGRLR